MICNSKDKHVDINPILQVQDVRIVQTTNSASERYRLLLSDGVFTVQGMLATQNNDLVKANKLVKGSVVKLNEFVCNRIQTRVYVSFHLFECFFFGFCCVFAWWVLVF